MATLLIRRDGAIGYITVSNAERRNAMTFAMWEALPEALLAHDRDPAVRVIVIEGDGDRAFISGSDISQFEAQRSTPEARLRYNTVVDVAQAAPAQCTKPVVARMRGLCFGGGVGLAVGCDLRICSSDTRFRIPAARTGIGYPASGVRRLAAVIGPQHAYDLLCTARTVDAAGALQIGLVTRVFDTDSFDAESRACMQMLAENAPLTLRAVKLALDDLQRNPGGPPASEVQQAIDACFDSDDYREGARAFLEKRTPLFRGA